MADLIFPFIILTLLAVIIIQAVERYFYASLMQSEQSKLIAAIMSKNMNEYTHAVRVEKEKTPPGFSEPTEVDLSQASDDEFDRFIKESNKN